MSYKQIETFRNVDNCIPVDFSKLQDGFKISDPAQAKGYKQLGCTDVDGLTEYRGYFLMQEWKGTRDFPMGQKILAENFTKLSPKAWFIQVHGYTETMEVFAYRICKQGVWQDWVEGDLDDYNKLLASWCAHVHKQTSRGMH